MDPQLDGRVVPTRYDDLTDHQKRCCDNIITRLPKVNRSGKVIDEEGRKLFWDKLQSCPFQTKGIALGNLTQDSPPPIKRVRAKRARKPPKNKKLPDTAASPKNKKPQKAKKRQKANTPPTCDTIPEIKITAATPEFMPNEILAPSSVSIPVERRAGAQIWVVPRPTWKTGIIGFDCVDRENGRVNQEEVTLFPGTSWTSAKVETIVDTDILELERAGAYNFDVAVFYAKAQLLNHLNATAEHESHNQTEDDQCRGCVIHDAADMEDFVEIRLLGDLAMANKELRDAYIASERRKRCCSYT
ncbi:hypothetical protein CkaCkLH20_12968 [Colletotrichum karsti]|uniref:Uncharacterized protein n=1 Tax=Colletotrichum karsti TaxID=1095194 RepID=A0A9P6I0D9_9PEZI|nr:uncharacterized protein CkaCkLH20_12968 [Colletotrichum karsti]KAF9869575.1 hypothetical protein CkaCkLH20_12968 [Colletotrichum karsti]